MAGAIAQDRESCQFPFVLDEKPDVVPGGSGREQSGGARNLLYPAARSNSERAAPSACVGRRFSVAQIVWDRSIRRAVARGGARVDRPRWLRILTITGGSSIAAMIFKAPPQFGQRSMSMSRPRPRLRTQAKLDSLKAPLRAGTWGGRNALRSRHPSPTPLDAAQARYTTPRRRTHHNSRSLTVLSAQALRSEAFRLTWQPANDKHMR